MVNVSARNHVGTGADILNAGFTISGSGEMSLLIRAVGLALDSFGVPGVLADPLLEIYSNIRMRIATHDNRSALSRAMSESASAESALSVVKRFCPFAGLAPAG